MSKAIFLNWLMLSIAVVCIILNPNIAVGDVIQSNFTDPEDTFVRGSEDTRDTNYSSDNLLITKGGSPIAYGMIKFDITQPETAYDSVVEANLTLTRQYVKNENDATIKFYLIESEWEVSEVTWDERMAGVSWGEPGGDIDSEPFAQITINKNDGKTTDQISIPKEIVQEWLDNPSTNYGIQFRIEGVGGPYQYQVNYHSSETGNPPDLQVNFIPEPSSVSLLLITPVFLLMSRKHQDE